MCVWTSPIEEVSLDVCGKLLLPLVSIREELLLVIEQFLVCLCGELKVRSLHDGIHWTRLLTEPAIDALGHVDVVACGSSAAVGTCLCLNGDSLRGKMKEGMKHTSYLKVRTTDLCWAYGLAEFACNAPLLSIGVSPEGVLPTKPRADRALLEWIVESGRLPEECTQGHAQAWGEGGREGSGR